MKKIIVASILATLLFQGSASAGVIKGSSKGCKVGSVKLDSKYKYTCVKKGRWKKTLIPVKIDKSAPKPATTVIVPEISPVAKQENPIVEIKLTEEEFVLKNAIDLSLSLPGNSPKYNISYQVDPSFSNEWKSAIIEGQSDIMARFGHFIGQNTKIFVIMSNSKEYALESFNSLAQQGHISQNFVMGQIPQLNRNFPNVIPVGRPGWGYLTIENNVNVMLYAGYENFIVKSYDKEIGAHELFHVIQNQINSDVAGRLPCWVVEGQASFFGAVFSVRSPTVELVKNTINSKGMGTYAATNLRNIEGSVNRTYGQFCGDKGEYQQGSVAVGYLISKYGIDKQIEFLKESSAATRQTDQWVVIFNKVFGVSVDSFYSDVEKYLKWFYNYK
jgi:hypothetical protein